MTQQNDKFTPSFGRERFGCDFFTGAKPNPDSLVSRLAKETSVAVLGLRKIGKTSLLAETRERLRTIGKKVVWVDLDVNATPAKALIAMLRSMQQGGCMGIVAGLEEWVENSAMNSPELKSIVRGVISGVQDYSWESLNEKYVEVLYRQIGKLLETQRLADKPVIIFDELTTLIKYTIDHAKPEETRMVVGRLNSFLGQLRYWRKANVGICMAVSGSVSINWLQREYGIRSDSILDCIHVDIEELDRDEAMKLLKLCADATTPSKLNEQLTEELLDFLPAYFPGVVQLVFQVVNSESNPISSLDAAMRRKIDIALSRQYYEQFDSRFQRYGSSERNRINKLFAILVKRQDWQIDGKEALEILENEDLAEDEPDGREIINHLRSDSFIDMLPGGFCFSSGLVPAWHNFQP